MDVEKIIRGLECCTIISETCMRCPYEIMSDGDCIKMLSIDALELIKSQQSEHDELHTCIQYQIDKAYGEVDGE